MDLLKKCTCHNDENGNPLIGGYAGCPSHDPNYSNAIDFDFITLRNSLTENQKLHALAYKYYQGAKWDPKKGDYYTTSRADLELYRIVDITDTKILTQYTTGSDAISEWDKDGFLTEGFGVNRVYVPDFIFRLK